jgi:DNA-binding MarR family transcriptional regulator
MATAPREHTVPSACTTVPDAWVHMLKAHASLTRSMDADLRQRHGLTLNDYEVLLLLAKEPEGRLRRVDLAERVLLTQSGITRLLDGLESSGFVDRAKCASDARVSYAEITPEGARKLSDAAESHVANVRDLFEEHYSSAELATLAELLGRLPVGPSACSGSGCSP